MSKVDAFELLEKELQNISEISKQKKFQYLQIKEEIKHDKIDYNESIKQYKNVTNEIIEQETLAEETHKKISKKNFKFQKIKANINDKYYTHLEEISSTKSYEEIFTIILNLMQLRPKKSIKDNIRELKNEKELKDLLEYLEKVYNNLYKNNIDLYNSIVVKFKRFKEKNTELINEFPFDTIFEYFENIFDIIQEISQKEKLEKIIEEKTAKKNNIFLSLKSMERKIQSHDNILKSNIGFIKGVKKLNESYLTIKSKVNTEEDAKALYDTIQKLKNFYFESFIKFDNMSSLSLQSEYTYSENSSMKSLQTLPTYVSNMTNTNYNSISNDTTNNNINQNLNIDQILNSKSNLRNSKSPNAINSNNKNLKSDLMESKLYNKNVDKSKSTKNIHSTFNQKKNKSSVITSKNSFGPKNPNNGVQYPLPFSNNNSTIKMNEGDKDPSNINLRKSKKKGNKEMVNNNVNENNSNKNSFEFDSNSKIKPTIAFISENEFRDSICDEMVSSSEFKSINKNFEIGKYAQKCDNFPYFNNNNKPKGNSKKNVLIMENAENVSGCCRACV